MDNIMKLTNYILKFILLAVVIDGNYCKADTGEYKSNTVVNKNKITHFKNDNNRCSLVCEINMLSPCNPGNNQFLNDLLVKCNNTNDKIIYKPSDFMSELINPIVKQKYNNIKNNNTIELENKNKLIKYLLMCKDRCIASDLDIDDRYKALEELCDLSNVNYYLPLKPERYESTLKQAIESDKFIWLGNKEEVGYNKLYINNNTQNLVLNINNMDTFNTYQDDIIKNNGTVTINGNTFNLSSIAFTCHAIQQQIQKHYYTHYISAKKLSNGMWVLLDSLLKNNIRGVYNNLSQLIEKCVDIEEGGLMPRMLCFAKSISSKQEANVSIQEQIQDEIDNLQASNSDDIEYIKTCLKEDKIGRRIIKTFDNILDQLYQDNNINKLMTMDNGEAIETKLKSLKLNYLNPYTNIITKIFRQQRMIDQLEENTDSLVKISNRFNKDRTMKKLITSGDIEEIEKKLNDLGYNDLTQYINLIIKSAPQHQIVDQLGEDNANKNRNAQNPIYVNQVQNTVNNKQNKRKDNNNVAQKLNDKTQTVVTPMYSKSDNNAQQNRSIKQIQDEIEQLNAAKDEKTTQLQNYYKNVKKQDKENNCGELFNILNTLYSDHFNTVINGNSDDIYDVLISNDLKGGYLHKYKNKIANIFKLQQRIDQLEEQLQKIKTTNQNLKSNRNLLPNKIMNNTMSSYSTRNNTPSKTRVVSNRTKDTNNSNNNINKNLTRNNSKSNVNKNISNNNASKQNVNNTVKKQTVVNTKYSNNNRNKQNVMSTKQIQNKIQELKTTKNENVQLLKSCLKEKKYNVDEQINIVNQLYGNSKVRDLIIKDSESQQNAYNELCKFGLGYLYDYIGIISNMFSTQQQIDALNSKLPN